MLVNVNFSRILLFCCSISFSTVKQRPRLVLTLCGQTTCEYAHSMHGSKYRAVLYLQQQQYFKEFLEITCFEAPAHPKKKRWQDMHCILWQRLMRENMHR